MEVNRKPKNDSRILGLIYGIIVPIITLSIFYIYRNPPSFGQFYDQIVSINILSRLVSLCVVPNLLIFFLFMWRNKLRSAYGVIGATFIYAIVVLILTTI